LFFKVPQLVQQAILDSGLEDSQINQIILVGGSTSVPKMRTLLQEFFFGRELHQLIDVKEVVAYGAAIQAAIPNGNTPDDSLKDLQVFDVAPLAIGIGITYDINRTLVKPNTMFPVTKTYPFYPFLMVNNLPIYLFVKGVVSSTTTTECWAKLRSIHFPHLHKEHLNSTPLSPLDGYYSFKCYS